MGSPSPAQVTRYDVGDMITLRATFTSTDFITPADPSQVYFFVKDPWGNVATFLYNQAGASVIRTGTGGYFKDFSIPVAASAAGDWSYRYTGTGYVQAADEWTFQVEPTKFAL